MKLVRLRRALSRKYSQDQPRAPAGQSDGGRWVSSGGAGGIPADRSQGGRQASLDAADPETEAPKRTLLDGGGEVLTLRIRSGRGDWDEEHTVVTPDGDSRVFENNGDIQTIRDGQTGEVLSRSPFATSGSTPEATLQPAFLPVVPFVVAPAIAATIEAGALLFTYLLTRPDTFGRQPGRTAFRYDFQVDQKDRLPSIWVGRVDQTTLNDYCPLNSEVQEVTDEATRRLKALNPHLSEPVLGTLIHYDIGETFKSRNYPNVRVEYSIDQTGGTRSRYGKQNSVRLDLYEYTPRQMVCVYDYKTGRRGLSPTRALLLARIARMHFPDAKGVVIVQVRPN
ncbi:hypothetical protein [Methylobacterium sp. E-045]|uniref:hypothetical protein n=1 Tax=Methylobacterium sp. E-045 TaxID=2836575 RepID=UPI001FBB1600|nr:hypothetical protein [Methylobacterium sp. E-045]